MITRRLAILGVLLSPPAVSLAADSGVWAAAQSKERYLLAQMGASVRAWTRIEGRRQAAGPLTEAEAVAGVLDQYPDLSPKDASTLAFVVLMVAARDLDTQIRQPNPPAAAAADLRARRDRLGALLTAMAGRTPDMASAPLRALR